MAPVRFHLFGSPKVDCGGESIALPFERRNQLLVLLALRRSWVGRAELAAIFWPEQPNKLAYANLRKTLFRLQSVDWASGVENQGQALRFDAGTDVFDFEAALREQRVAEALPLRRGELLAGFEDDRNEAWSSWLHFERDRLRVAWRGAALERLAGDIDAVEGIDLAARLLEADPLDEAALRAQMRWLAHSGQGAAARQAYREFAARLMDDLGLAPGAELKALHDSLGTAFAVSQPPAAGAPAIDDGFVGRSVELRRIAELVARDDCRLLCIIGPGGVGKTRLARRALQDLAPAYADGVAFVALEDVALAGEIGGRLALEIGVGLAGSAEPLDQVVEFLRDRHMLLVLDNFEHLAAGASILDKMLRTCPRLRIIVTSRVRLGVAAEWSLPLEGLPCPEIEDQDRIEAFDAARLFVAAAQRVAPGLVPSAEAPSIVDICRQLEGLPLALELAAAWTRVLTCEAIAAELRHGTELLHAVDPARPARHASIEMVFDQSWKLLTAIERDTLSRLSVFRGGFSAEAARAVTSASLPVLGALADKSLLRKDGARIFLHPVVHQLAAERLDDEVVRASTEAAYAQYFHRMLAQLRGAVEAGDRAALNQLDTEFENCRTAWLSSVAHGRTQLLTKSALALLSFCEHRGRGEEGLALFRDAVDAPQVRGDAKFVALLLAAMAQLQYRLDRYGESEATAKRALAESQATRDHDTRLQCFRTLGAICIRLERHAEARRYFEQGLRQAPPDAYPRNGAVMLGNLALVEKAMGRYDESLRMSVQSMEQYRRLGDVAGEAVCLTNLGNLHMDRGDLELAGVHLKAGLDLCDRHGLVSSRGRILANLTELALKTGDLDMADAHGRRALEVAQLTANRAIECWLKLQFARIALKRDDLAGARTELRASVEIAIAIGRPALQLAGVVCLAEVLEAQGALDCARAVLAFAMGDPSMSVPGRDEIRKQLAQWEPAAGAEPPWPGLGLDELVHRIVVEASVAHGPLIASIRGTRQVS